MGGNIFTVLNSRYKSNIYLPGIKNKELLKRALNVTWEDFFTTKIRLYIYMRSSTENTFQESGRLMKKID